LNDSSGMGKAIIIIGLIVVGVGVLFLLSTKFPWIGRLPGDFYLKGKNFSFYFPLATSLLFSVILTAIFWLINRR
jgi:hypothetical protein